MWFTDATIAFVKETIANLKNIEEENAVLRQKLLNYERRLEQFSTFRRVTAENSSDELFYKNVYVGIGPDEVMPKPVLLDEAIEILTKEVNDLREQLVYSKKQRDICSDLLDELTKAYPGILDEVKD